MPCEKHKRDFLRVPASRDADEGRNSARASTLHAGVVRPRPPAHHRTDAAAAKRVRTPQPALTVLDDDASVLHVQDGGNVGLGTDAPLCRLHVEDTDAVKLPVGTTAQQPSAGDLRGMVRFNDERRAEVAKQFCKYVDEKKAMRERELVELVARERELSEHLEQLPAEEQAKVPEVDSLPREPAVPTAAPARATQPPPFTATSTSTPQWVVPVVPIPEQAVEARSAFRRTARAT